jgi:hypothetical protein
MDNNNWISDPKAGAQNLLADCVGLKPGETLLLVREDARHGKYDEAAGDVVAEVAAEMGAHVFQILSPPMSGPESFPDVLGGALQQADHAVFFSGIGDQIRFSKYTSKQTASMCYALDVDLLGSPFCSVPHSLMKKVAASLRQQLSQGGEWNITCPLGTDLKGYLEPYLVEDKDPNAFTVELFPLGILPPISASTMNGRVATKWIMSTQNRQYEPSGMVLDDHVFIDIQQGRLTEISGPASLSEKVQQHYNHVAGLFDIDRDYIHSWHTGIHPKTHYTGSVHDDMTRWGTVTFNSPRYTHIHTCGDYPPGEIALVMIDATITLNDEPLWQDGKFVFLERSEVVSLLKDYPGHEGAFEMLWNIGL